MRYNAKFFIKKFRAIPSKLWTVGEYRKGNCRCALGHCGETNRRDTEQSRALARMFGEAFLCSVMLINDKETAAFPQKSPKARILAALRQVTRK